MLNVFKAAPNNYEKLGVLEKLAVLKIFERCLQKQEKIDVAIKMMWLCHKIGYH